MNGLFRGASACSATFREQASGSERNKVRNKAKVLETKGLTMAEQGGTSRGIGQGVREAGETPFRGSPTYATGTAGAADWYAARVRAGREAQALDWLERKAIEGRVLWSYVLVKHNRSKKLTWRARRLAPGYVFVQLSSIELSSVVRQCEDIVCFVGGKHRPLSLRTGEMGTMLGLEAAEEFEIEVPPAPSFAVGDEVIVLNGPAAEQKGLIVKMNGKREVSVELAGISKDRIFRIAIDKLERAG